MKYRIYGEGKPGYRPEAHTDSYRYAHIIARALTIDTGKKVTIQHTDGNLLEYYELKYGDNNRDEQEAEP